MHFKIASFGELLWDKLPSGPRIGGAPANLAVHAWDFGLDTRLITALGNDASGEKIRATLARRRFPLELIHTDPLHPTGTVDVTLDERGTATYHINEDVAWDYIPATDSAIEFVKQCDAFCYGTLAQRSPDSRTALETLLKNTSASCVRLLDINLRRPFPVASVIENSLRHATHLKLNDDELSHLSELHSIDRENESAVIRVLFRDYPQLSVIILTRGAEGADIYIPGEHYHVDAPEVHNLVDTVGAGDAFTAGFLIATLRGGGIQQAAAAGNALAAKVCATTGAWLPPIDICNAN